MTAPSLPAHRLSPAAIPRGALGVLALAVLAAHGLLLWQQAPSFGVSDPPDHAVRMLTRQIAPALTTPAPAVPVAATAPAPRQAAPQPAAARSKAPPAPATANSEQNRAPVRVEYGVVAPETVASAATVDAPAPVPATPPVAVAPPEPALAAAAPPVQVPGPVRLRYSVTGLAKDMTYHANAQLLWKPDGARYEARLEVSAFLIGSRVQTSAGQLTPQGLAPTRFSDKSRSEQATHFEREKNLITFSGNAPQAALQPGAQDRLSVVFQLAGMLAADPARYPAGSTVAVQTAGPRDATVWTFEVAGDENLRLGSGEVRAIRLVRPPRHEFDQKVELWFAPSVNYLPVRIKLTQVRGDFVDQVYESSETP